MRGILRVAALVSLGLATGRNNMPTFRQIHDADQQREVSEFIVQGLGGQAR